MIHDIDGFTVRGVDVDGDPSAMVKNWRRCAARLSGYKKTKHRIDTLYQSVFQVCLDGAIKNGNFDHRFADGASSKTFSKK